MTSSGPTATTRSDPDPVLNDRTQASFDPTAPFIGSDGHEYACAADKLLDAPIQNWRNENIRESRRRGTPESKIRAWIDKYDGTAGERAEKTIAANFWLDARGYGLRYHGHDEYDLPR